MRNFNVYIVILFLIFSSNLYSYNSVSILDDVLYVGNKNNQEKFTTYNNYIYNNLDNEFNSIVTATDTFTILSDFYGGGKIIPAGIVKVGAHNSVSYEIIPDIGYKINSVFIDGESKGIINYYIFEDVVSDHTIKAIFELDTFMIEPIQSEGGIISPDTISIITYEDIITYSIIPDPGYKINSVFIDSINVGKLNTYTFKKITSNKKISALFELDVFLLEAIYNEDGGTVTPPGIQTITYKDTVSYKLIPNKGYKIKNVFINDSAVSVSDFYTFYNITENIVLQVIFALDTFEIEAIKNNNGTIYPDNKLKVTYKDTVVYKMFPNVGYKVDRILVDNRKVSTNTDKYTFTKVLNNHTIQPVFVLDTFEIFVSNNGGGIVFSSSGKNIMTYNDVVTYEIIPNLGFKIKDVLIDNVSMGAINSYTFKKVLKNYTFRVLFEVSKFEITSLISKGGKIIPTNKQKITYKDSITYTIIPDIGYSIYDVLINDESIGVVNSYTFRNVLADQTIGAVFNLDTFVITTVFGHGGKIYPLEQYRKVTYNDVVTYNIVPDNGYIISDVLIDGISIGSEDLYTFSNVTENHLLEAFFIQDTSSVIQNNKLINYFYCYPNPTSFNFNISGVLNKPILYFKIEIYDMLGNIVYEICNLKNMVNNFNYNVNVSNLNTGIYNLVIYADNEIQNEKIVIKK